jgi:pimeloyl-ACP methyl ester carboxylesterase
MGRRRFARGPKGVWGVSVAERQVEIGSGGRALALRVREWRAPDAAAPAVVLVHGLASNARIWDAVAPRLAERFRVVAYDQRGHGLSDKPAAGYGFAEVTADLRALLATLDIARPILVGHSWGGNVVLQHAADHPADVRGLVLVDGGFIELADDPDATWERVARELAPPDLTALTFDQLLERARSGPAGAYWSDAVSATLRTSFEDGPDGRIRPRLTRERHLAILRALWEQRPSALYGRVACPTLLVPARRAPVDERGDRLARVRERRVARALALLPRGRVVWMEDTVHDVPLQRPDALARSIAELADEAGA